MTTNPEGLVKALLQAAGTDAGSRVYFAVPEQVAPTMPLLTVAQTGGAPDETGQGSYTMRIEAYAADKRSAAELAAQAANALAGLGFLDSVAPATVDGRLQGGGATSVLPASGRKLTSNVVAKRYVVLGWVYVTP